MFLEKTSPPEQGIRFLRNDLITEEIKRFVKVKDYIKDSQQDSKNELGKYKDFLKDIKKEKLPAPL